MGLLDSVIGSVLGQVLGGGSRQGGPQGGGAGGTLSSPIVQALIALLLSRGAGGLGDILGGGLGDGRREPHSTGPEPYDPDAQGGPSPYGRGPSPDEGDLGGFGGPAPRGEGDFSDLSGMLDGPADRAPQSPGQGPYAHLDREPGEEGGHEGGQGGGLGGGLGGLIESFERSGLGDVIGSWIGQGGNQPIAPNRLADALGPDTVGTLSRQTGLGREDLLQQLSQALPAVIDRLTPQGRPPSRDEMRGWL